MAKPFPFVTTFVAAIDHAIQDHGLGQRLAPMQRTWLAFCLTAILGTHAVCGARVERASLGTYSLAALWWMLRQAKIPWALLLVASGRGLFHPSGITPGSLVIDDTDKPRAKSAQPLASLHPRRDQARGGVILGPNLVLLLVVTPQVTLPLGGAFSRSAPALPAWYKQERTRKQPGSPRKHRAPPPAPTPQDPTKPELALRLFPQCQAPYPALTVPWSVAAALQGRAAFVDGAAALLQGVQVISQVRRTQTVRVDKRAQQVADSLAPQPGTSQQIRLRGGEEGAVRGGSARGYGWAHQSKRFSMALPQADDAPQRSLRASDLSGRTVDIAQAYPWRWLVEVLVQTWKSSAGWGPLTKQPGEAGARRSVLLSLLVDPGLFFHPAPQAPLNHNLPASTVGSLRAPVQVECWVTGIRALLTAAEPQAQLQRFTAALPAVFTLEQSKKRRGPRQLGRRDPPPS